MPEPRVVIIGGGAAGLSAAIAAARLGVAVTLLEAGTSPGRKILASGNGRCNLTSTLVSPSAYNHPEFVEPVLDQYPCEGVRAFFGGMGLLTCADDEGRVYPATNAAASVLEVMRLECAQLGVDERYGFEVAGVAAARAITGSAGATGAAASPATGHAGFEVTSRDGETVRADAVIVCAGGGDSLLTGMGHGRVECVPVLGPIRTNAEPIRRLSGIRVRCAASLLGVQSATSGAGAPGPEAPPVATERGELLFREYGVSGIMIFDLSRFLEQGSVLSIDFFPDVPADEFRTMIAERCTALPWRTAETFLDGMLHHRVAQAVLRVARIDPKTPASELPQGRLTELLKDFRLDVTGRGDARQAQVTRGGAPVAEFEAATMQSRLVRGLFAAGEVLDVDGRCGGFNLHWAWASGIVAGENAARAAAGLDADAEGRDAGGAWAAAKGRDAAAGDSA